MMRISMGYPDAAAEALMIRQRDTVNPLSGVSAVADAASVSELIAFARSVHVAPAIEEYTVALSQATRADPSLHLGASPRATLQLIRAAKVRAALDGRDFVIPDDVSSLLIPVLAHRLLPARGAHRAGAQPVEAALRQIAVRVRVPVATRV
jgi:MoxR-like ATPase